MAKPKPNLDPYIDDVETLPPSSPLRRPNPELLRISAGTSQLDNTARRPLVRRHFTDEPIDLPASRHVVIHPGSPAMVPTDLRIVLPVGTVGLIVTRYSTFHDRGLLVPTLVLSAGYQGEIVIPARNLTAIAQTVRKGERIAQLLVLQSIRPQVLFQYADDLPKEDGHGRTDPPGSTGR